MLVKNRELMSDEIEELMQLRKLDLNADQLFLVEKELRNLRSAEKGRPNPARFLNFYCADSRCWALIHDLRIEANGETIRFDHILINRFFDMYVVDSGYFFFGLKITADGEFLIFDGRQYRPINPPLDDIERRVRCLESILVDNDIVPKRLGISFKPHFKKYMLVSPHSVVLRPPACILDTSMVVSADEFTRTVLQKTAPRQKIKKMACLSTLTRRRSLAKLAERMVALHSTSKIDFAARLNIDSRPGGPIQPLNESRPLVTNDYCI